MNTRAQLPRGKEYDFPAVKTQVTTHLPDRPIVPMVKADGRITVPSFNILYKTLADDDGWESGLGPFFPDRAEALDFFNKKMARDKKLGQFTFDDSDPTSDYNLVE